MADINLELQYAKSAGGPFLGQVDMSSDPDIPEPRFWIVSEWPTVGYAPPSGPTMAGRWASVQNGFSNLSGIVTPSVAGIILHTRGSLRLAFSLAGVVSLVGALIWYFMVSRVEPVQWGKRVPAAVTR